MAMVSWNDFVEPKTIRANNVYSSLYQDLSTSANKASHSLY